MAPMESATPDKGSRKSRNPPRPLPLPAHRALAKLGGDLRRARLRRRWTQQSLAERAGVSLNTVKRMESGDPRMQWQMLARVLVVYGDIDKLHDLLDTGNDDIGLALLDEQLPRRIRPRKNSPNAF
ncbi:XRE family transcriptional regulator [Candidatus Symbiobacter mobilis CR]|uniref:XRE family transcriptional regulator n=1 Tax=Candidatus Symbiobacter mobilis CR TaxID=946483 RepID=U5NAI8_9BURK|nr:XRE family transcriptional regulator [Candidatus Symbiobacter mobilis CR]